MNSIYKTMVGAHLFSAATQLDKKTGQIEAWF